MKVVMNFRPRLFYGATKNDILGKVQDGFHYASCNGSNMLISTNRDCNVVRVYSLQKVRKEVYRIVVDGKTKSSKIVAPNHWIAYVYDIPGAVAANLVIKQGDRTYTVGCRKFGVIV